MLSDEVKVLHGGPAPLTLVSFGRLGQRMTINEEDQWRIRKLG